MNKGRFIVLEGIDGAGTTTQAQLLTAYLSSRGIAAYQTAEPSKGRIGQLLREWFLQKQQSEMAFLPEIMALMYAADRLDHVAREINSPLKEGVTVICDRYVLSSLVYQGLSVDSSWIETLNKFAPSPDLTILVDVDLETAKRRREFRQGAAEVFDDDKTQALLRKKYLDQMNQKKSPMVCIDGGQSPEEVLNSLIEILRGQLGNIGGKSF